MNISNELAPASGSKNLQLMRQINDYSYPYVAKNQALTLYSKVSRFSKSSQLERKDLLSHLNLYNPMNISLGGNSFITTFHDTKIQCSSFSTNDIFTVL